MNKLLFVVIIAPFLNLKTFAQTMDWVPLPGTTNGSVTCLTPYNGKLVACGHFDKAGNIPLNNIAAWDGTTWSALGNGIHGKNTVVYHTYEFSNELYAVGNFDSAGTVAARDIAKWNGNTWTTLGSGSDSMIYCAAFFNNELYAAGHFSNIGGVPANNIAKWNGSNWQALGSGIKGKVVRDLCLFQGSLYAAGNFDTVNNMPAYSIGKWTGTNWSAISNSLGVIPVSDYTRQLAMIEWNGKLLIGDVPANGAFGEISKIEQWDGNTMSDFTVDGVYSVRKFLIYNNKLYSASGSILYGGSNVALWNAGTYNAWSNIGSCIIGPIWGLCEYNGELYCSGVFNSTLGACANYIAKLSDVTDVEERSIENSLGKIFPNPVKDKLRFEFSNNTPESLKLNITNTLGQVIYSKSNFDFKEQLDVSFLKTGIYYLKLEGYKERKVFKVVKE